MSVFCSTFTLPVVGVIDMKPPIKPLLENYFCAAKIKKSSDKFLFLVSDADLYVHIISVGFRALCLKDVNIEEMLIGKIDVEEAAMEEEMKFTFGGVELLDKFNQM